jgi:hypothetical protein
LFFASLKFAKLPFIYAILLQGNPMRVNLETATQFLFGGLITMNRDQQMADNSIEPISAAIDANGTRPQEDRSDAPDDALIEHRTDRDGSERLDDPAHEAIAQFFATPLQFRRFKSVRALAEHFGVSRMTIYRRAENVDVVQRIKWLLERSMHFGDLIACREWAGIMKAQVQAALSGDTRAAIFCQNRAWRQSSSILGDVVFEPATGGVDALATSVEEISEVSQGQELDAVEENSKMDQGRNPQD